MRKEPLSKVDSLSISFISNKTFVVYS